MGQITLTQETNQKLLDCIYQHGYGLGSIDHDNTGMSKYEIVHPKLEGHFFIQDRYDYFENNGNYPRYDCRFAAWSQYEYRALSEHNWITYHSLTMFRADPEQILKAVDLWAAWIIESQGYGEPLPKDDPDVVWSKFASDPPHNEATNIWKYRDKPWKWIITPPREPVRYVNGMHLCDFTLANGVDIWKPVEGE